MTKKDDSLWNGNWRDQRIKRVIDTIPELKTDLKRLEGKKDSPSKQEVKIIKNSLQTYKTCLEKDLERFKGRTDEKSKRKVETIKRSLRFLTSETEKPAAKTTTAQPKREAKGPRASRKEPFDIPTIDNSLRLAHKYGGLSVEEVAKKMYDAGLTHWVDLGEAKKLLAKPITATPSQIEDAKAKYKFRREHASEIEAIKAKVDKKLAKTTAQKSEDKPLEPETNAPKAAIAQPKKTADKLTVKTTPAQPKKAAQKPAVKRSEPKPAAPKKEPTGVKKPASTKKSAADKLLVHNDKDEMKVDSKKPIVINGANAKPKPVPKVLRRVAKSGGYTAWDDIKRNGKTFATEQEAKDYAADILKKTGKIVPISPTDRQVTHTFKPEEEKKKK